MDSELRIAIGHKLMDLVADGVTDPIRLRKLTLDSLSDPTIEKLEPVQFALLGGNLFLKQGRWCPIGFAERAKALSSVNLCQTAEKRPRAEPRQLLLHQRYSGTIGLQLGGACRAGRARPDLRQLSIECSSPTPLCSSPALFSLVSTPDPSQAGVLKALHHRLRGPSSCGAA
jgi:hypothetical protein